MKKMTIFFISLFFCFFAANAEEFLDSYGKVAELGWLGLAYCMGIDDESEIKQELDNLSLDPTRDKVKIMDSKAAFNELKQYIDTEKEFYDINDNNPKLGYKNFKGCIKMFYYGAGYGSGYQFEVERIVKKYCKDCK